MLFFLSYPWCSTGAYLLVCKGGYLSDLWCLYKIVSAHANTSVLPLVKFYHFECIWMLFCIKESLGHETGRWWWISRITFLITEALGMSPTGLHLRNELKPVWASLFNWHRRNGHFMDEDDLVLACSFSCLYLQFDVITFSPTPSLRAQQTVLQHSFMIYKLYTDSRCPETFSGCVRDFTWL